MSNFLKTNLMLGIVILLAGCAEPQAVDFPKKWKPLNELAEQPKPIPLIKQRVYEVTQLDTTVKGLLERWGEEANIPVIYDYTYDFTLFKAVLNIHHTDLNLALKELTTLYENQGVVFDIKDNVIIAHKKENTVDVSSNNDNLINQNLNNQDSKEVTQ